MEHLNTLAGLGLSIMGLLTLLFLWGVVEDWREDRAKRKKADANRAKARGRGPAGPRSARQGPLEARPGHGDRQPMVTVTDSHQVISGRPATRPTPVLDLGRRAVPVGDIVAAVRSDARRSIPLVLADERDSTHDLVLQRRRPADGDVVTRLQGQIEFKDAVLRRARGEIDGLKVAAAALEAELTRLRATRLPAHPVVDALYGRPMSFAALQQRLGMTVAELEPELLNLIHLQEQVEQVRSPHGPIVFQLRAGDRRELPASAAAIDRILEELTA